ncbi:zinc finger protein CKR1 isoform X2 [Folsomia candida]|uniref:zinc finger protein CKR1 isoform X2 n=1 Tax=Folsomia candida TaxID=158441 RepID=UPI001604D2AF|nr:zinc finger protein CKR1 isoform X2 [Folsomia candida]
MTSVNTLLCGNCCSVNTPGNLVSSILLQNEYEVDGATTTTISISNGLSFLFSYWVGVSVDDKATDLHFCPECAHIFRELHRISVQFLKLSGTETQVAKRLAELRKAHKIRSSPTYTKAHAKKKVTRGQRLDLRYHPTNPTDANEENIQIKKDPDDNLDLLIKEEEDDLIHHYPEDPPDFDEASEVDDFAIDPLKFSGDESSSGDDDNDSEPDNAEPDTAPATPNPLQCSVCFKTFSSQETRDRHFRHQHDESFTPLPCPADNCDLTFKRGEHLRTHLTNYHPGMPCPPVKGRPACKWTEGASSSKVPCRVAEVPLKMQRNAKGSQEAKAKSESTRVRIKKPCPICGKQFNSNFLNTHIRTHSDERKHLCTTCGKLFRTSRYLSLHIQHVHIREKKYHCDTCGKGFVRNYEFKDHVKRLHGNLEKSLVCETCGKTFRTLAGLRQHRQIHYDKDTFECPICHEFTSNSKANISAHVRRVHEGRKKAKRSGRGRPPDDERRVANSGRGDEGGSQNSSEQGYPASSSSLI